MKTIRVFKPMRSLHPARTITTDSDASSTLYFATKTQSALASVVLLHSCTQGACAPTAVHEVRSAGALAGSSCAFTSSAFGAQAQPSHRYIHKACIHIRASEAHATVLTSSFPFANRACKLPHKLAGIRPVKILAQIISTWFRAMMTRFCARIVSNSISVNDHLLDIYFYYYDIGLFSISDKGT